MARSSPTPGESKTPLIVALVFFVLLTLGLGVLYYMSFDENKAALDGKKSADADKAVAEKKLRAEQDKVKMYRVLTGSGNDEDLNAIKNTSEKPDVVAEYKFATGRLDQLVQGYRDIEAGQMPGTPFTPKGSDVFVWPEGDQETFDKAPGKPLFAVVVNQLAKQLIATRRQAIADRKVKEAEDRYNLLGKSYDDTIKVLREEAGKFPGQLAARVAEIQKNYDAATQNFTTKTNDYVDKSKERQVALDDAEIKKAQAEKLAEQYKTRATVVERDQAARADPFGANTDQPHGKILSKRNGIVTINLGSADNVRPGLTMVVQPPDTQTRGIDSRKESRQAPGGEPIIVVRTKGTIEVLDVIGPTVSTARIVSQDDPIRDSILPGDLLYNAAWRKGAADHVALFGVFDMDADGTDDIKSLIRDLNRVGVVVDAYYDLEKNVWVGKYNQQTAFAVEGYYPISMSADGLSGAKSAIIQKLEAAKTQVLGTGIKVVKARDFFPRTGYKIRLDITPDTINRAYNRYLLTTPSGNPDAPPAEPKN